MAAKPSRLSGGFGIELDRSLLDQLGIDESTPFEVSLREGELVIRPIRSREEVGESVERKIAIHGETLLKLSE